MKTRIFAAGLLLWVAVIAAEAQQPKPQTVSWAMLKDVKWSQKYVASLSGSFEVPEFGRQIEFLDNRSIVIEGFYMPVDMEGKVFAISETPSYMCFFCGAGGIESVMEIVVEKGYNDLKRVRTDRYIQVSGTLHINRDDPEHLMYLLKDAQLVKVIR